MPSLVQDSASILYEGVLLTQDPLEELVETDKENSSNAVIRSFLPKKTAPLFLLFLVTFGVIISRTQRVGDIAVLVQNLWFVPNPGHRDHQGNFVADTWDHFQLPACACYPPIQQRQVPKGSSCATSWPDLFTKADCSTLTCAETGEPTTEPRCVTVNVAIFNAHPQLNQCCYNLKTAEQFHRDQIKKHWEVIAQRSARAGLLTWQGIHRCGPQEYGVDFQGIDIGRNWWGGATSADCQKACTYNAGCRGFSWCPWCGCWLKKFKINETDFNRVQKTSTYSGFPCELKEQPYQWLSNERAKHSLPTPSSRKDAPTASMLCVEVITPYSYELDLVTTQYQMGLSIFQLIYLQFIVVRSLYYLVVL